MRLLLLACLFIFISCEGGSGGEKTAATTKENKVTKNLIKDPSELLGIRYSQCLIEDNHYVKYKMEVMFNSGNGYYFMYLDRFSYSDECDTQVGQIKSWWQLNYEHTDYIQPSSGAFYYQMTNYRNDLDICNETLYANGNYSLTLSHCDNTYYDIFQDNILEIYDDFSLGSLNFE